MPTYESSGSLTTVERSFSSPQTPDLTGLVYTLNGETISVDVVGSPGTASEEVVTQSLGGATSYDLTWSNSHSDFEVVFNLSTADTSTTPQVDDLTLTGQPNAPEITVSEVTDIPDISLSWPAVDTADEYRVYRAESPGSVLGDYTQIDTTATVDYTDTTATLGTRYYYVVTAYNTSTGESEPSNEVRAEPNTDEFTEQISWGFEYGDLTGDTVIEGGGLSLADLGTLSFDWSLEAGAGTGGEASTSVQIEDTATGTLLLDETVSVTGFTTDSDSGTISIDVQQHPELEFTATVNNGDNPSGTNTAEITGPIDDTVVTIVTASGTEVNITDSETQTELYNNEMFGGWTGDVWDFTNTTTATKLSWSDVSYPAAGDDITVTIQTEGGGSSTQVTLTAGSDSTLVALGASDRYQVSVDISAASDDSAPSLGGLTLEAHTPVDGHTVTDSRETEQDLAWNPISVCDGYEVYQSESTPVTTSDALAYSNTDSTVTSTTITGLENGERYYYNVRPVYSGE